MSNLWERFKVKRNLKIAAVIGIGVFYFMNIRPVLKDNKNRDLEKFGREAFKIRHPDLAARVGIEQDEPEYRPT